MKIPAPVLTFALFLGVCLGSACGDSNNRPEAPPVPTDPTRTWVEKLSVSVDEPLRQHAEARATGDEITKLLNSEARRGWYDRIAGGIKYADLFQELYAERENHKAFARSNGLSARGESVLAVLTSANNHALDPAPYHVARISTISAELSRQARQEPEWETIRLEPAETERLIVWMRERELDPHAPETRRVVLDALLGVETVSVEPDVKGDDSRPSDTKTDPEEQAEPKYEERQLEEPPAPRIIEAISRYESTFKKSAKLTAELELRVADGALRYARDMKHFNLARLDWRDIKAAGGSKNLIYGRLSTTYDALVAAEDGAAETVMANLEPLHPQYGKLKKALARYRAIAADGGWEKVRRFDFEPGTKHRRVPDLRKRLAKEGFLEAVDAEAAIGAGPAPTIEGEANNATGAATGAGGSAPEPQMLTDEGADSDEAPDDEIVDDELVAAIKSYQESHQFRPTGESTGGFWRSLNLPVERRITQLELALQRWRETQYRGEEDFIHVNIPDFHAEVWFDSKRTMRFRVVAGNNQRKCDRKEKKWRYPNATPVQVAELDHMIFNPYWNVPKRIVDEEIRPKIEKDSSYLEKNHYEFVETRSGREWVRQTPGDHNALGRVKFIFPNPHNTYMHDTPKKKYFDYPVRAFSHGCVRVQDPLDFAEQLLVQSEKGDRTWMEEVVESGKTRKIEFDEKIPVFFEYVTVRVDDQGRTNFLADIYRKDKRRLSDDPDAFDDCSVRRSATPVDAEPEDGADDAPEEADVGP